MNLFSTWTKGSVAYQESVIANHTKLFFQIADTSVFDWLFLVSVITTGIIIAINGSGRIRYHDIIEEKKKGKKNVKRSQVKDILSKRFGDGYKKSRRKEDEDSSDGEDAE